jgi:hypothetical protein
VQRHQGTVALCSALVVFEDAISAELAGQKGILILDGTIFSPPSPSPSPGLLPLPSAEIPEELSVPHWSGGSDCPRMLPGRGVSVTARDMASATEAVRTVLTTTRAREAAAAAAPSAAAREHAGVATAPPTLPLLQKLVRARVPRVVLWALLCVCCRPPHRCLCSCVWLHFLAPPHI